MILKLPSFVFAALTAFFTSSVQASPRPHIVRYDEGGYLDERVPEINARADAGQKVVVDGYCASACTLYLVTGNVCATKNAKFLFHQAHVGFNGPPLPRLTKTIWAQYPKPIRSWLAKKVQNKNVLILKGRELVGRVPICGLH